MKKTLGTSGMSRFFLLSVLVLALVAVQPAVAAGPIDLNTASQTELIEIPGVGEVIASRIIDYREEHKFQSVDELERVKGIGEKTLAKIRGRLTVSSAVE